MSNCQLVALCCIRHMPQIRSQQVHMVAVQNTTEYKTMSGLFANHCSVPSDILKTKPAPDVRLALCVVHRDREGYFLCEPTPKHTVSNNRLQSSVHLCSHDNSQDQPDATNISISVYTRQEVYWTARHVHSSNLKGCMCE